MTLKVICPVCKSSDIINLYHITSHDSALVSTGDETSEKYSVLKKEIENIWSGNDANMKRCGNCSFVFAQPFIAGSSYFYSVFYSNADYYPQWKWDYEKSLEFLKHTIIPKNSGEYTLLELGAGNGAFVKKVCETLIPAKNIVCTEFSDYGVENIRKVGINCYQENVWILKDKIKRKFDFICMFQILEHIDRLELTLQTLTEITTDHAFLLITVPNHKHHEFYDDEGINLDLPPIHISRWNAESIRYLFTQYGWEIIAHRYQPINFLLELRHYLTYKYHSHRKLLTAVKKIRSKIIRKIALFSILVILFFKYLKRIVILRFSNNGISQWFCLKKIR